MTTPGRRLPDIDPTMSLNAAGIAVSEMTGISLDRLTNFILVSAAIPRPEDGTPDLTEIVISSPATVGEQIHLLRLALADLEAIHGGEM